jgi:hypothetical protein
MDRVENRTVEAYDGGAHSGLNVMLSPEAR